MHLQEPDLKNLPICKQNDNALKHKNVKCDRFAWVYYYHNDNWRCLDQFPSWQICESETFEDWEFFYVNTCKIWKGGSWCFIKGEIINCVGHLGWCWCPTLFISYRHYCIFHSTNSQKMGYSNPCGCCD